jgi:hypothetical protein
MKIKFNASTRKLRNAFEQPNVRASNDKPELCILIAYGSAKPFLMNNFQKVDDKQEKDGTTS